MSNDFVGPSDEERRNLDEHAVLVGKVSAETGIAPHVVDTVIRGLRRQGGRPLYGDQ